MAATIGAIATAAAAAASIGTGISSATRGGGSKSSALPTPTPAPSDLTTLGKQQIPSSSANAASRLGSGISPEFLANLVSQDTGQPGLGLDVLGDIQAKLGSGGLPGIGA